MIIAILFGLAIALLLLRWFLRADPAVLTSALRRSAIVLLVLAIAFLLFTKRLNFIFPLLLVFIPLLLPTLLKFFGNDAIRENPFKKSSKMTIEEAYEVLDLEPGANRKEIKEAHKRLMKKVHPDTGGSNYMAQKLNEAKDLLLSKIAN